MKASVELWGGIECTLNRVGDDYLDQLTRSGHIRRRDDLGRFAALGLKTLRFPMLWEQVMASGKADWSWLDEQLGLLQELGIKPIAGLMHHGSGPRDTDLLDPDFPEKLAAFAATVADRYPWIELYTPINEPLTTARFSGLYGFWYPHRRDAASCLRMLLHQCRAIGLSMQAIRRVNPEAQLVQTEDLGKIFSTYFLQYQAQFENERRWLSLDLLMGRVREGHPLWSYILDQGITANELEPLAEYPCVPSIIGINHYITSNRFLDERLERYPPNCHGGNGRHRYADIEAVRVGAENLAGPRELLLEVWERYRTPIAVTEVHLGCTRDEQLRWLHEIWQTALSLREEEVDIRAVTVWSLLGAFDWDSLLTRNQGHYESGVYDLRSPTPRPTALAQMVRALSEGQSWDHPVLDADGWWHRPDRLLYPLVPLQRNPSPDRVAQSLPRKAPRQILITGYPGRLASACAFVCESRGLSCQLTSHRELDIADRQSVQLYFEKHRPWAVINAAGGASVDAAERDPDTCRRAHIEGPRILAEVCAWLDIPLVTFSCEQVFDGQLTRPYKENDSVAPLNLYGRSKAQAEGEVLRLHPGSLVIRTSACFGPWDEDNFLIQSLRRLGRGLGVSAAEDLWVSPTYLPDLLQASLDLLIDGETGLWHLCNVGLLNSYTFGCEAAQRMGLNSQLISTVRTESLGWQTPRPRFGALSSDRGLLLPPLEHALNRFVRECRVAIG